MSIKVGNDNIKYIVIDDKFIKAVYIWENGVRKTLYQFIPPVFYRNKIPYATNPSGITVQFIGGSANYFKKQINNITLLYEGENSTSFTVITGDYMTTLYPIKYFEQLDSNKIPYTIISGSQPDLVIIDVDMSSIDASTFTIGKMLIDLYKYSEPIQTIGSIQIGNKTRSYTWFQMMPDEYMASVVINDGVTFTFSEWKEFYKAVYRATETVSVINYLPNDFKQFYY